MTKNIPSKAPPTTVHGINHSITVIIPVQSGAVLLQVPQARSEVGAVERLFVRILEGLLEGDPELFAGGSESERLRAGILLPIGRSHWGPFDLPVSEKRNR